MTIKYSIYYALDAQMYTGIDEKEINEELPDNWYSWYVEGELYNTSTMLLFDSVKSGKERVFFEPAIIVTHCYFRTSQKDDIDYLERQLKEAMLDWMKDYRDKLSESCKILDDLIGF